MAHLLEAAAFWATQISEAVESLNPRHITIELAKHLGVLGIVIHCHVSEKWPILCYKTPLHAKCMLIPQVS